ncbi:MAG: HetP family heterocyst commitment protein [Synechococcales cyanobacterium C42_A2020_086]|jgi:hypothetical protein|nr:HetP family heterocyst commitment protein [Synechococcales cyanobacterium M58_A2018_015]MBF2074097.1 HetP family heterocyst commitment protein [Synechococcales cyanobacterium C42_A2020_086]
MNSNSDSKLDKAMSTEQFTQVVEAIMDGKYSWACVLILRFAGYNPLHYIPYRTYNRLMKENGPANGERKRGVDTNRQPAEASAETGRIADLHYLEHLSERRLSVRGGHASDLIHLEMLLSHPDFSSLS